MPRPCPFVSCPYHLASDAHTSIYEQRTGLVSVLDHPDELSESCALDVTDAANPRERSLDELASLMHLDPGDVSAAFHSPTARRYLEHDEGTAG